MKYRVLLVVLGLALTVQVWLLISSHGAAKEPPVRFAARRGNEGDRRLRDEHGPGGWHAEVTGRTTNDRRFGNLPGEKIKAVRKIEQDYTELRMEQRSLDPPSDRAPGPIELESRRLLSDEMHRDIAAVLSPAELEEYDRRNSAGARRVAGAVRRDIDLTDAEFLALAQLQDRFEADRVRSQTESAPDHTQLRAILPDDRFYAYLARIDPVYQVVNEFARGRVGLTPENTYKLYQLQRAAWETHRVSELDSPDGKRRLAELNVRLEALLGIEGAAAYRRSYFGHIFAYPTPIP